MENAKLQRWAELLLDTGKRNNLINFKNRYSSVCDVVYPDAESIFASAIADASFSVYNLANEERRDLYNDELDDESNKEAFLATFSPRVNKANTLLVYTAGEKTERTFRNIYKKSKSVLQETGVNIAYIAFGFINWKDGSESLFAPLLLLPVVFSPFGVGKLPEIEILESEITVNPSFAYKCECEYGIKLPEYVFGTGLNDYLELVKERVEPIGWFVTKECKISTFSFLKINMYRDIEDNAELITQNQNVRVLLGEGSSCYDFSAEGDKRLSNVIDADNSQEQAIRAVLNGQSIVLQGPPGTGKSQTITNIIAECMANGKTVLFVSEKLAALNVVYEKLKNAGLNELCLELHSHKANKKDLIAEICNCLKSEKCRLNAKAEGVLARREEEEKGLNAYVDKLHQKQPNIEKSLYELINCYFDCGCDIDVKYSISNIGLKNEGYLYEAVNLMEEYVAYQDVIGVDYRKNCWYGYNNPDSSYSALNKTERAINDLVPILASVKNIKGQLKEKYSIEAKSLSQLNAVGKLLTFLAKSKIINEKIIPQPRYVCDRASALNEISKKIKEKRGLLLTHFNPSILLVDSEQTQKLIQSLNDGSSLVARVFGKKYKEVTQFLALHAKSNNPLKDKASVYSVVNILREYNLLLSLFNENVGDMAEILGENFSSFDTDWNAVINEITKYRAYLSFDLTGRLGDLNSEEYALAKSDFELLGAQLTQKCALQGEIYHLVLNYDSEILNFYNFNVDRLYEIILDCKNNIEQLRSWCAFLGANNRAKGLGVSDFIDFYLDQNLPLADMPRVYKWVFYFNYIEYIISSNPELEGFSRILQDRRVKNFVKTDKECLDVNKAVIRARMSDKKPSLASVSPESQIAMILHEGEKKRMQKSIRNLLAEGCEVIQTLKPCFLMSPLSVSTFLTGGRMSFDVVVFDEASQIFPQDAIGAI